jgi:hypothetical protein
MRRRPCRLGIGSFAAYALPTTVISSNGSVNQRIAILFALNSLGVVRTHFRDIPTVGHSFLGDFDLVIGA